MLKNKSVLECKINGRTYTFDCDSVSPLGETFDAIYAMQSFVIQQMLEEQKRLKEEINKVKAVEAPKE